ncbi:hypothetical protein B0T26DRAFT_643240 [Lasiosphaeria miniovina]|uniref:Uncharacterized protein n=1 Tax=Lasiosphaeria miniovina TaxID=1954250 RepID=A0AA40E144_9PEZI|nr:uncharacterized protein B0T26DRAFT_643240 [Lasiosphaeria miniovina]KAK0723155.1 hypothetical protein B0T26DRAFT_643240 [Lasiosphaeria miniovina]
MPSPPLIKLIYGALLLLAIDAAISLSLVSSMVSFLHHRGGAWFAVAYPPGSSFNLAGHPANLIVNQGHTSNGASGTALVLVGFGGVLALWLEHRSRTKLGKSSPAFYIWGVTTVLSCLLTLTALVYTFVVTAQTAGQAIDLAVASRNSAPAHYPDDSWTPENWYDAVLGLPLTDDADRDAIARALRLMRGWRFNLIPLFVLGFVLGALVVLEVLSGRKPRGRYGKTASGDVYAGGAKQEA